MPGVNIKHNLLYYHVNLYTTFFVKHFKFYKLKSYSKTSTFLFVDSTWTSFLKDLFIYHSDAFKHMDQSLLHKKYRVKIKKSANKSTASS